MSEEVVHPKRRRTSIQTLKTNLMSGPRAWREVCAVVMQTMTGRRGSAQAVAERTLTGTRQMRAKVLSGADGEKSYT